MSIITGVAPGLSNEQVWEQTKFAYFKMIAALGIDLYSRAINVEEGFAAYGRCGDNNNILLGNPFFNMPISDRLAVLIHEEMHIRHDTSKKNDSYSFDELFMLVDTSNIPDWLKQFIEIDVNRKGGSTSVGIEFDIPTYLNVNSVKSPDFYLNELGAYSKEMELCPDSSVSFEYALERKYKIWKYELLLKKSYEIFN